MHTTQMTEGRANTQRSNRRDIGAQPQKKGDSNHRWNAWNFIAHTNTRHLWGIWVALSGDQSMPGIVEDGWAFLQAMACRLTVVVKVRGGDFQMCLIFWTIYNFQNVYCGGQSITIATYFEFKKIRRSYNHLKFKDIFFLTNVEVKFRKLWPFSKHWILKTHEIPI